MMLQEWLVGDVSSVIYCLLWNKFIVAEEKVELNVLLGTGNELTLSSKCEISYINQLVFLE